MYKLRLTSLMIFFSLMISGSYANSGSDSEDDWDDIETRTYDIGKFDKIFLDGGFKVILEQKDKASLRIKADEESFDNIEVETNKESLEVSISKKHFSFDNIILYICIEDLSRIEIEGGVKLETKGYIEVEDIQIIVSGAAIIEMDMKADRVIAEGDGGVNFEFEGVAEELDATISGAGHLDAEDLLTKYTRFKIEGFGFGSVNATEKLDATISGAGKIRYKGHPVVNKTINGLGMVSED